MESAPAVTVVRLALIGFGAVNKALLRIEIAKREEIARSCSVRLAVVGVCDSRGGRVAVPHPTGGLTIETLLEHKKQGNSVKTFPEGVACDGAAEMLSALGDDYDILVDGSPYGADGGIALDVIRTALKSGKYAVLANKAPLVAAFTELARMGGRLPGSRALPRRLKFSAAVCGGLPVINAGARDLSVTCTNFSSVEGVFNSTTNYILAELGAGRSFDAALAEAQRLGIAEADPSLDIDGHDTASKLIIIANAVLGFPACKADVAVEGVRGVTPDMVAEAKEAGEVFKLVATATPNGEGGYTLSVRPQRVPATSFLGGICGWEMGVVFRSDLFDVVSLKIDEPTVTPTSAAVLRDILHCVQID